MSERWKFSVRQSGVTVAEGDAPTEEEACREAFHYAMMYARDGPQVRVTVKPVKPVKSRPKS